ncbi:MAG: hypothetical protein MZU97_05470 [Bacillus subtilis]|nr:hypothetical protein [Bacillus subtilis]
MTKFTQIIAIIDKSGSMEAISEDTIDGFNQFLDRQIALEGEASITAVLFNDKVDVLTRDAALDNARLTPRITSPAVRPRCTTPSAKP